MSLIFLFSTSRWCILLFSQVCSLHPVFGSRPFNQPADGGVLSLGYDFKAGGKISCCCVTFSATNNLCLAIHLSTSHPVSVRLSASLMDSTRANSQVVCSVAAHGVRRQLFGLFPLRAQCGILQLSLHSSDLVIFKPVTWRTPGICRMLWKPQVSLLDEKKKKKLVLHCQTGGNEIAGGSLSLC